MEIGIGLSGVALFAMCAVAVWVEGRKKMQERELAHAERMKTLELGKPLPDAEIHRATADMSRARAAGAIGVLVPLITAITGAGVTALLLYQERVRVTEELIGGIWMGCGIVALVTVSQCLSNLRRRQPLSAEQDNPPPAPQRFADSRSAVTADRPSSI